MKTKWNLMGIIVLAFYISFLALPLQSLAASEKGTSDVKVTIGDVKGSAGEVVEVPVKMSNATKDVAAYGIEIHFDKEQLKVIGITPGYGSTVADTCANEKEGCFWKNFTNDDGFLRAAWADPSGGDHPIKQGSDLFTIKVEILKTDFLGEKSLTIPEGDTDALSFTDPSGKPMTVAAEVGKLDIVKSEKAPSVEVTPEKGSSETNTDTKASTGGSKTAETENATGLLPKTGDDSYIDTYLNIGIAVLAALLLAMLVMKKRRKIEKN